MLKRVLAWFGIALSSSLVAIPLLVVPASAADAGNSMTEDGSIFVENSDVYRMYSTTWETYGWFPSPNQPGWGSATLYNKTTDLKFNCDDPANIFTCDVSYKVDWDPSFGLTRTYVVLVNFQPGNYGQSYIYKNLMRPGDTFTFDFRVFNKAPFNTWQTPYINSYWVPQPLSEESEDFWTRLFDTDLSIVTPPGVNPVFSPPLDAPDIPFAQAGQLTSTADSNRHRVLSDAVFSYIPRFINGSNSNGGPWSAFDSNDWRYKLKPADSYFGGGGGGPDPEPTPGPETPSYPPIPDPVIPELPPGVIPVPDLENGGEQEEPRDNLGDCAVMDVPCVIEVLFIPKSDIGAMGASLTGAASGRFPFNFVFLVTDILNDIYKSTQAYCAPIEFNLGSVEDNGQTIPWIIKFEPCIPEIREYSIPISTTVSYFAIVSFGIGFAWRLIRPNLD